MLSPETPRQILECALEVASLGLRIHPLIRKQPLLDDWPEKATADRTTIADWLADESRNYGIVCDRVAVIDTDSEALAEWWESNMPVTPWSVRTPGGGTHFYYRSIPGLRNAVKAHRGWDVRAGGRGYVVGFGSQIDGRQYELIGEPTLDLPPFDPAWLPPSASDASPFPAVAAIPRGRIRDLRAYIRRIVSIQGQRGSDACFRVACVLRDEGKTPEETLEYMIEWNAECAQPQWSVAELTHKIRDAYALIRGD